MKELAIFVAIAVPLFVAILLLLILSGNRWRAAEKRARGRRLADAEMNARLFRLNL